MAGDWIKMRKELPEDPAVIAMAAELNMDEFAIVGRLHRLWSWADSHTCDGNAIGVTISFIDRFIDAPGFANALVNAGWLIVTNDGILFPKFDRHNGKPAKTRALTARRKAACMERKGNAVCVTREEKRREENITPLIPPAGGEACASAPTNSREPREPGVGKRPSGYTDEFEAFWSIWAPTVRGRKNKPGAFRAWWSALAKLRKRPEVRSPAEWLNERARVYVASDLGLSDYAQGPAPWLNQESFDVPDEKWRRGGKDSFIDRLMKL